LATLRERPRSGSTRGCKPKKKKIKNLREGQYGGGDEGEVWGPTESGGNERLQDRKLGSLK